MQHAAQTGVDHIRQHDAQRERHHGKQVADGEVEVALRQMHAEQQDVAGLSVGEDLVATHVGVHVHEAAHQGEDDAELDGLGYLPCSLHYLRFLCDAARGAAVVASCGTAPPLLYRTILPHAHASKRGTRFVNVCSLKMAHMPGARPTHSQICPPATPTACPGPSFARAALAR